MYQEYLRNISPEYVASYGFGLPWNIPHYKACQIGECSVSGNIGGISESYLAQTCVNKQHHVLRRGGEPWMSTSLLEVESHAWHSHCATGNVLIAGLGMGMCLHAIATKEDVRRVVVIEIDPEVIQLMSQSTDFDDWSCRNKITILQADALAAETAKHVEEAFAGETIDYFYADIWPVFPAPEAPAQTGIMCELYKPAHAGWWGQEVEYGLWNEDSGQPVSIENMTEFFMQTGVKASLIPGYVSFCEAAISAQLGYEGPTPLSLGII